MIFCEAYAAPPYNESWELANAQAYLQRFFEIDPAGCFIAERNGEVTGAIFFVLVPLAFWQSHLYSGAFRFRRLQEAGRSPRIDRKSEKRWCLVGGSQRFWRSRILSTNGVSHRWSIRVPLRCYRLITSCITRMAFTPLRSVKATGALSVSCLQVRMFH